MSSAAPAAPSAPAAPAAPELRCPTCRQKLRPEQDWCLACGSAVTTRVRAAPHPRGPLALVAVLLALALVGVAVTFSVVTRDARHVVRLPAPTAAPAPVAPPPAATATPAPAAPATPAAVGTWPAGRSAWTVVLFSSRRPAVARSRAQGAARAGVPVGVLRSSGYRGLRPGYAVVFSGQYGGQAEAAAQASALGARAGTPGAYARRIVPR